MSAPAVGRWRRLLAAHHTPLALLTALVAVWVVVMGRLIWLRHHHFLSFDFDTGLNDQYIWQAAHGRQWNTVRGLTFLGNHAYYALLLFVPLVWLGGTVSWWDWLHSLALGSAAFPLFFLARDKLGSAWLGFAAGAVWLLQPSVQWFVHEGFHPEGYAVPFLFGTYLYGERWIAASRAGDLISRRTRWGLVACFVLTITWKEDLALALVGMGIGWALRRQWRLGLRVAGVAALYFVVVAVVLIPRWAGGSVFGAAYDLGQTPTEIVRNVAAEPSLLVEKLDDNDALAYGRDLSQSWGFVPLASPGTLLIGLPQATIDIISAESFTWNLRFHYQVIPLAAMAISFVEGAARLQRWRGRGLGRAAVIVALLAALLCTRLYGPSPLSIRYRDGWWPLRPPPTYELKVAARAVPAPDDGVSADYLMVPHLSHREVIYTFPNPWRASNFGVTPGAIGDQSAVDWVIIDRSLLKPRDARLLRQVEASGEFAVRSDEDGVVVLQRIKPPGQGERPIVGG